MCQIRLIILKILRLKIKRIYRHSNQKHTKALKKAHLKDYQKLYNTVDFKLNTSQLDTLPTNRRLKLVKEGGIDLGLEELLFQYGRYLLISSSRPGTNPANLQGLWNEHIEAPWNADYHLNINLQMNYWMANTTQLDTLNSPLFDFIDRLIINGKTTAQKNLGAVVLLFLTPPICGPVPG